MSSTEGKKEKKERRKSDVFEQFQTDHRPKREHMGYYLPSAVAMTTMPICKPTFISTVCNNLSDCHKFSGLYVTIFGLDIQSNLPLFAVVTVFSSAILTLAYHNVAYWLKVRYSAFDRYSFFLRLLLMVICCRLLPLRDSAIVSKMKGDEKRHDQKQKKKRLNEATTKETILFSLMYNNALYLFVFLVLSFFIFRTAAAS